MCRFIFKPTRAPFVSLSNAMFERGIYIMRKSNSKSGKRCWNLSLPFEDERFYQLEDEFMKGEKVADLFRQKEAMHKQIIDALPGEKKSVFSDYSDNNSRILGLQPRFYYKRGFLDAASIMRFLRGVKNNIKLIISVR